MTALVLAGPSNRLRSLKAGVERTINWQPVAIESAGKGGIQYYLQQCAGLASKTLVGSGEMRGLYAANGVLWAVVGALLFRIKDDLTATDIGYIAPGRVSFADNATQLCISTPEAAYVYDFTTGNLSQITENWLGSVGVQVLDGYGIFAQPNTTTFYITANQDFTSIDALQYASAEGSTGSIVAILVRMRELVIFKERTAEVWYDGGASDFPLARNDGANIQVGCAAAGSVAEMAGVAYWLGRDKSGQGIVFAMSAYSPQRISHAGLEQALSGVSDISGATGWTYHQEGRSYYCLRVPGLPTTWVYDIATQLWFERAEWTDGNYALWRPTCHAFAFGRHWVGDANGYLYELTYTSNTHAGDTMVRDRITPHVALPTLAKQRFGSLQIDCDVGDGTTDTITVMGDGVPETIAVMAYGSPVSVTEYRDARMLLRLSNDGGRTWGNWRTLSLGEAGKYKTRVRATMLGSARDRVWHIRVTDDVMCNVLSAVVNEL